MIASVALVGFLVADAAMGLAAPAPESTAPAPEGAAPASKGTAPAPEGAVPASKGTAPAPEGTAPAPEGTAPPPAPAPAPAPAPGSSAPEAGVPPEAQPPQSPDGVEGVEPAPLPPKGRPPPEPSEPKAWGGAFDAPLPRPPKAADPSWLVPTPWRGRFWLGVGLAASFPLSGRPPAAGGVISAAGEIDMGWRVNRILGLHTSISSFAHDAGQRTVTTADGISGTEVELGRITAFDLATARMFVPAHPRIEPWGEVGLGVGARRAPFAAHREAVGLVRVGAGVDFWLAPSLTLAASAVYRTTLLGDTVGHGLRAGADLAIHW